MARNRIYGERRDHTIQPTALIHEAYLVLVRTKKVDWADRTHFFAVAGRVMRRILVDYARQRGAAKRPDGQYRVELDEAQVFSLDNLDFMLALDRSMDRLRERSERACQVVELHAFAGLSLDDIAMALNISERTVKRDWRTAKVWLYQELYGNPDQEAASLG